MTDYINLRDSVVKYVDEKFPQIDNYSQKYKQNNIIDPIVERLSESWKEKCIEYWEDANVFLCDMMPIELAESFVIDHSNIPEIQDNLNTYTGKKVIFNDDVYTKFISENIDITEIYSSIIADKMYLAFIRWMYPRYPHSIFQIIGRNGEVDPHFINEIDDCFKTNNILKKYDEVTGINYYIYVDFN